ncbi:MAG: molybdopterin-synthase adenylyltransferase MoeB [Myxococcota bacterium]
MSQDVTLSHDEIKRYSRHLILPEVGLEGQKRLKASKVLMVGAGGLGSPLGLYLTAAGVGTLGIVDFDVVDHSNLQRQILHGTPDVGRPKLQSAADRLKAMNPHVNVVGYETLLTSENALEIFRDYDVIVDGTDNFATRYLVNDACVLLGKPNVYGSIFRFEGQASVFWAEKGPCYRCLYEEPPPPGLVPSCAEGGVLGILPGLVGVIQATEVIKLLLGQGESLIGRLLLVDALSMRFRELKLRKNPDCVLCGPNATQKGLIDYEAFCGMPQSEDLKPETQEGWELTAQEVQAKRLAGESFRLIDVRNPHEWDIARIPGATLLPLPELAQRMVELSQQEHLVLYCYKGTRSMKALNQLRDAGFTRVRSMKGGIDAWSQEIDPSIPRY